MPPDSCDGITLRGAAQPDAVELHQHEVADHVLGQVGVLAQRERDVLEHRQVGEQRPELEQHADLAAQRVEPVAVEVGHRLAGDHDAARSRPQLPADQPQDRRLAAARAAHDRDDLPRGIVIVMPDSTLRVRS
jgi:hypothetical protein